MNRVRPISAECACERCGTPFQNHWALNSKNICRLCEGSRRGFDACYTYGSYEAELRDLIHLFKYGRIEGLARPLARRMLLALPRGSRPDVIVPVPMHWWKRWRRGFNQAERLAAEVSHATGIPARHVLRRSRYSGVQAGLASTDRRKNALRSFSMGNAAEVTGKSVLLVDDVFTTGATATVCARLLKRAGATEVRVLTVARVDRRAPDSLLPSEEHVIHPQPKTQTREIGSS